MIFSCLCSCNRRVYVNSMLKAKLAGCFLGCNSALWNTLLALQGSTVLSLHGMAGVRPKILVRGTDGWLKPLTQLCAHNPTFLHLQEVQQLGQLFIRLAEEVGCLQPGRRPLLRHGRLPLLCPACIAHRGLLRRPAAAAGHRLDCHIHPDLVPQPSPRQGLHRLCLRCRKEPCRHPESWSIACPKALQISNKKADLKHRYAQGPGHPLLHTANQNCGAPRCWRCLVPSESNLPPRGQSAGSICKEEAPGNSPNMMFAFMMMASDTPHTCAPLLGQAPHEALQVLAIAGVQQPVGLIKHQHLQMLGIQHLAALEDI